MGKYSAKQLEELSVGVFKSSPKEEVFYASSAGTFYNQHQYDKLEKDMKDDCIKIENPALAKPKVKVEETEEQKAEREAKEAAAAAKKAAAEDAKKKKEDEAAAKKAAKSAGSGK